ncbi:hypothetical protein MOV98_11480 [Acinetobacter variabilis]|nr:hypothetical protein MOV98_11480 [Acinetobacter variabilis]
MQYRDDRVKLEHLDLLTVNSYNPINAFKAPLSWGFSLGWKQEALDQHGQFSTEQQHGIANFQVQGAIAGQMKHVNISVMCSYKIMCRPERR